MMTERIAESILTQFNRLKDAMAVADDERCHLFASQLKSLSETVLRQETVLKTINAITEIARSNIDIGQFISHATQAIKDNLDFDQVDIFLLDAAGQQLQSFAGSNGDTGQTLGLDATDDGYFEQAIKQQKPQLIHPTPEAIRAAAPLVSHGQVIGLLNV